jgi:hypothetical protein
MILLQLEIQGGDTMKTVVAGLTALFVVGSSAAFGQAPSAVVPGQENWRPSAADLNALIDARIAVVKAALQLTPEQAKYWPAVEEAIRTRAMGRHARLAASAARLREPRDADPIELLRQRADTLSQRAAGLKQLADAWQPLYATLTPDQKQRMRFLAVGVLHILQGAAERRRMEMQEEEEDED